MIKTTRAQRVALFQLFKRDFPSWVTPTKREPVFKDPEHPYALLKVPSIQYRRFLKKVQGGPGCIMIPWCGMWLGIEPDGYTHS